MKVLMLEAQRSPDEVYVEGQIYDIPEGQALTWIASGTAQEVEKPLPPMIVKGKEETE